MNMKTQKSINKPINLNLKDATTLKCDHCENYLFIQSFILKTISALVSPTGKEELITIPIFTCGNCGNILDDFKHALPKSEEGGNGV